MVTDILPAFIAVVVAFIAYKVMMGLSRILVIIGVVGVVGYLYANGTFG
jgi:hypothetical protein